MVGKVIEIFLPTGFETTTIGFKIDIDGKLITIIQKQDMEVAKIYKEDYVYVDKVIKDNKEIYYVKLRGEDNE